MAGPAANPTGRPWPSRVFPARTVRAMIMPKSRRPPCTSQSHRWFDRHGLESCAPPPHPLIGRPMAARGTYPLGPLPMTMNGGDLQSSCVEKAPLCDIHNPLGCFYVPAGDRFLRSWEQSTFGILLSSQPSLLPAFACA